MKFAIFAVIFSRALLAQTSVNVAASASCPPSTATRIVIALSAGSKVAPLSCLILDPASFVVDKTTNPPTVHVAFPTPPAPSIINFMDDDSACAAWLTSTTYTLTHPPNPASSLSITQNGLALKQGVDFTVSGSTVTFLFNPPAPTDTLVCRYRY